MKYVSASIRMGKRQQNKYFQYQVYISDVLQVIAQNTGYTSYAVTNTGKAPKQRYADLVNKQKEKPKEKPQQSGKDIAKGIIGGLQE